MRWCLHRRSRHLHADRRAPARRVHDRRRDRHSGAFRRASPLADLHVSADGLPAGESRRRDRDPRSCDVPRGRPRRRHASHARDHHRRQLLSFTVFGMGNLMNVAVYPILLVDHFNASNSFIGAMTAVSSATMIVAYLIWGRMIDRGSSIRLTLLNTVVTLLIPIGYIAAADVWLLIPVAIVGGIVNAGGEITFFTNIVQIAPRDRIGEYATAQSLLMGLRGTAAPFIAAALLGVADPRVVLLIGVIFMTAGCAIMAVAVLIIASNWMTMPAAAVQWSSNFTP